MQRIRRMEKNLSVEQLLMETKSSDTGCIQVSKFLRTDLSSESSAKIALICKCEKDLSSMDQR